jgi:hypothetical protein
MDRFLVSPDHTSPGAERAGCDTTNSSKRKVQDISYDDTIEDIQHDIEKLESVVENIKNIINDKRTKLNKWIRGKQCKALAKKQQKCTGKSITFPPLTD